MTGHTRHLLGEVVMFGRDNTYELIQLTEELAMACRPPSVRLERQ